MHLGIDVGKKGAFAIVTGGDPILMPMPLTGGEIDLKAVTSFLLEHAPNIKHAVLEKVASMPGQGVATMFSFGRTYGALEALLSAASIPYTLVRPQQWQKEMFQGTSPKDKPKDRSVMACQRLFPGASLLATERSKVPHDGMSDALLMAEYSRRVHG